MAASFHFNFAFFANGLPPKVLQIRDIVRTASEFWLNIVNFLWSFFAIIGISEFSIVRCLAIFRQSPPISSVLPHSTQTLFRFYWSSFFVSKITLTLLYQNALLLRKFYTNLQKCYNFMYYELISKTKNRLDIQ